MNRIAKPERSVPEVTRPTALRVLVFSDAVPERNGVGTYYHDLERHLRPRVERIELLCPPGVDAKRKPRFSVPMPGDRTQRLHGPPYRRGRAALREVRPHTIVAATPGPFGMLGMKLAKRNGVRLVAGFHTHFEKLAQIYWSRWFRRAAHLYLERKHRHLFAAADTVLANSDEMADIATRTGAGNVIRVGTPIAPSFLESLPKVDAAAPLRRVLFAGRLAPEKSVSAVLDLARARPDLEISIAGDGPLRADVEREAARCNNVRCLGWVPRSRMRDLVDGCDAFVLPSSVESFGTAAFEAMARSRTVLVSERCGILDWPELEHTLHVIRDDESLADAIARIEQLDPEERASTAERAREAAVAFADRNTDQWIEILAPDRRGSP